MRLTSTGETRDDAGWQWEVALSFAGAQRDYVEQVAEALKTRGVRCFYDADEQIDLWGKYLAEELPAIYSERTATVVVFVSAEYAERDWTRLERRAALNRAVRERREYVLPARFDDTPLPGLLSDMVAVDLRRRTPEQFADMVAAKLAALAITGPSVNPPATRLSGDTSETPDHAGRVAVTTATKTPVTKTALVAVVMEFADIEDPEFRRQVLQLMGDLLGLGRPFAAPYRAMARDHVVAIVDRCWAFKDPDAARRALVGALSELRPDDGTTDRLRSLI
jgi:TIR domain/Effector-associated domain 2